MVPSSRFCFAWRNEHMGFLSKDITKVYSNMRVHLPVGSSSWELPYVPPCFVRNIQVSSGNHDAEIENQ